MKLINTFLYIDYFAILKTVEYHKIPYLLEDCQCSITKTY